MANAKSRKMQEAKLRRIFKLFTERGCCRCKNEETSIHAHHILPMTKLAKPSEMAWGRGSVRVLVRELLKCVPLCHKCHVHTHDTKTINLVEHWYSTHMFVEALYGLYGADILDFSKALAHRAHAAGCYNTVVGDSSIRWWFSRWLDGYHQTVLELVEFCQDGESIKSGRFTLAKRT